MNTQSKDIKNIKRTKGAVLYRKGDQANHLYIIISGKILLFDKEGDRFVPSNLIEKGAFLGQECLFKEKRENIIYNQTAIVLENTEYIRIEVKDIYGVLDKLPDWVRKLMGTIDERLIDSTEALKEHKLLTKFAVRNTEVSPQQIKELSSFL